MWALVLHAIASILMAGAVASHLKSQDSVRASRMSLRNHIFSFGFVNIEGPNSGMMKDCAGKLLITYIFEQELMP